jgi:uridylate kinase
MHKQKDKKYKRILLKLSGEALGSDGLGIDPRILDRMALEVGQLVGIGVQVGLVIGGGNLFRGAALHAAGMDRVTGDHMGMLATVMNALAMRDALERSNISSAMMSAISDERCRRFTTTGARPSASSRRARW